MTKTEAAPLPGWPSAPLPFLCERHVAAVALDTCGMEVRRLVVALADWGASELGEDLSAHVVECFVLLLQ